jgi:hypothetical protein
MIQRTGAASEGVETNNLRFFFLSSLFESKKRSEVLVFFFSLLFRIMDGHGYGTA